MKTSLIKLAGATVLALALSAMAHAVPINGSITFKADSSTTNTGNLQTATAFTSFSGVQVSSGTQAGSYLGTDGTAATFSPFFFSAPAVTPLWSFTIGSISYTFDATSVSIVNQLPTFLNVGGQGIAHITGYDDTMGTWSVTSTSQSNALTFSAATTVPDGGTTALLLGFGMIAAIASRRYLGKR